MAAYREEGLAIADTTLSPTGLVQIEPFASNNTWGSKYNTDQATINGWFDTGPALKVANGGTGATSASAARDNLGLGTAAVKNTGTSGDAVPLLNGQNTFSATVSVALSSESGVGFHIAASSHATSERASYSFGDFQLLQDTNVDGTKNLGLYQSGSVNAYLLTSNPTTGALTITKGLTITTGGLTVTGNSSVAGILTANAYRTAANAVSALQIDAAKASHTKSISSNSTFTVTNTPSSGTECAFMLTLTLSSGAEPTFWANVRWANGVEPVWSNGRWRIGFFTNDAGSNWDAVAVGPMS